MYDNKIRLSQDVLEKANIIASEWGLKNARAAVEAVFRKYADEYLSGSRRSEDFVEVVRNLSSSPPKGLSNDCEALNELDDLLGF